MAVKRDTELRTRKEVLFFFFNQRLWTVLRTGEHKIDEDTLNSITSFSPLITAIFVFLKNDLLNIKNTYANQEKDFLMFFHLFFIYIFFIHSMKPSRRLGTGKNSLLKNETAALIE